MFHVPEAYRICNHPQFGTTKADGNNGAFLIRRGSYELHVIASDGRDWPPELGLPKWEHVSVSLIDRIPSWIDMCFIKDLFWDKEDCIIQFHPPQTKYVDFHPYCLHLWRPIGVELPMPPIKCL